MFANPLAQNLFDGYRQLAGRRMIVMRVMNRMIFDREALEQYFLARRGPTSLRTPWRFYMAGMRNGSRLFWLNSATI